MKKVLLLLFHCPFACWRGVTALLTRAHTHAVEGPAGTRRKLAPRRKHHTPRTSLCGSNRLSFSCVCALRIQCLGKKEDRVLSVVVSSCMFQEEEAFIFQEKQHAQTWMRMMAFFRDLHNLIECLLVFRRVKRENYVVGRKGFFACSHCTK